MVHAYRYAATRSWFRRVGLTARRKFSALSSPMQSQGSCPAGLLRGMQILLRSTLEVYIGSVDGRRRASRLRAPYSLCPCAEAALRVLRAHALRSRLSPKEDKQRTFRKQAWETAWYLQSNGKVRRFVRFGLPRARRCTSYLPMIAFLMASPVSAMLSLVAAASASTCMKPTASIVRFSSYRWKVGERAARSSHSLRTSHLPSSTGQRRSACGLSSRRDRSSGSLCRAGRHIPQAPWPQ